MKLLLCLSLLAFVAFGGWNSHQVIGDGDDEDVVINIKLPACCSGGGSPGPSPSPSPSPSPGTPTDIPVGLVSPGFTAQSELFLNVARFSKAILNSVFLPSVGANFRFGDLLVRNTSNTIQGGRNAILSLNQAGVDFIVGPLQCLESEGARQGLLETRQLAITPGVGGSCISVLNRRDDFFSMSSSDLDVARALGTIALNDNVYLLSVQGDPRGDNIFDALKQLFEIDPLVGESKRIRRLRFTAGGPSSGSVLNQKLDADLAEFGSEGVTVIFALTETEIAAVYPYLQTRPTLNQFLTINTDATGFVGLPATAQLVAAGLAGVTDYLPVHVSYYLSLAAAFNSVGIPVNSFTVRVFDSFVALAAGLRNPFFVQASHEDVPSMRNFQLAKALEDVLSASGWLAVDQFGNRRDKYFQVRRLAADGSWVNVGDAIVLED